MTFTIHGGHNRIVPGASGYLDEVAEDRKVLEACQRLSGGAFIDCTDDAGTTQSQNLRNLTATMNSVGADYNLSIHLNSGGGTGCECLIWPGSRARGLAEKISANISAALGIRNRGVKERDDLYILRKTSALTIIIECAFVDSESDADKWDVEAVAQSIVSACSLAVAIKTGWQSNSKGWWYNDANGNYVTGWQVIDGKHYYFYPDGYMAADTTTPDGYYVNASGVWEEPKWEAVQKWWYRHADGSYSVNSFEKINGKWYYFGEDGYMVTGWKKVDGKWYFFGSDGAMLADTTTPDGYKVGSDGAMIEG